MMEIEGQIDGGEALAHLERSIRVILLQQCCSRVIPGRIRVKW